MSRPCPRRSDREPRAATTSARQRRCGVWRAAESSSGAGEGWPPRRPDALLASVAEERVEPLGFRAKRLAPARREPVVPPPLVIICRPRAGIGLLDELERFEA